MKQCDFLAKKSVNKGAYWAINAFPCSRLGFSKGMGSNVWTFKVQNGKYGGADEPQKPQNFVRPSK